MAILSLFNPGKSRAGTPESGIVEISPRPSGNVRSEVILSPRLRSVDAGPAGSSVGSGIGAGIRPLGQPTNTRLASVLGAQPQSFARGREVTALLLWTFAIFLSLALASYAGDPLASSVAGATADGPPPITGDNWVGPVGALVARCFVTLVGVAAWVVPLEAVLLGIPYVRGKKSNVTPSRLAGDILMVVIGAALVQVGGPGKMLFGRHPAGGMVGELFGEIARSLFSTVGSFLVGFALIGLILIGRATFSFIALMRWIARLGTMSAEKTANGARSVADAWRTARELEREKEEQRRRDDEPHIELRATGEATVLAPQEDDDGDVFLPDSESSAISAAIVHRPARALGAVAPRVTPNEVFPEESPLVVARAGGPVIAQPANAPRKTRRRKTEAELGAALDKFASEDVESVEASDDGEDVLDIVAKPKARARSKAAKVTVSAELGESEDEDDAGEDGENEGEVEEAPVARGRSRRRKVADVDEDSSIVTAFGGDATPSDILGVTPLDGLEVGPKSKRSRGAGASASSANGAAAASKKIAEITIVDTSAALEKDAPIPVPVPVMPLVPVSAPPAPQPQAMNVSAASAASGDVEPKKPVKKRAPTFTLPPLDMLAPAKVEVGPMFDEEKLRKNAELLVKTLADYKITGKVEEILPGPVVTTFEVSPVAGTKVSKVAALADDLALALAKKVRIVAPIPGKNRIGFELPNEKRLAVNLRDLVEDRRFQTLDVPLPVVLGRDIVGNPVYADLASMPHSIVAGATGAGKSVGLNVMLTSLLFRRTPDELRMLMIDPKVVELAPFDRIPHMLLPVVTDMKQAATALKWAVDEMERRYQLFADAGTKNIGTYNGWVKRVRAGEIKNPLPKVIQGKDHNGLPDTLSVSFEDSEGEQPLPETLPMIVIVVDEFADLMMQQGKEVESAVARLAQKARAAGMHVILATQRPSVDVITGMIKANFPTRIAFRVAQKIDSRTILDEQGAEHLLGKGDMLIKLNGTNETKRVQCPWVSEEEVQAITDFLRAQGEPVYDENILKPRDDDAPEDEDDGETDPMYDDAVRIVAETRRCSTSWLQRKLGLGYNRAARIVETMERRGLVGPSNGAKDREVLIDSI